MLPVERAASLPSAEENAGPDMGNPKVLTTEAGIQRMWAPPKQESQRGGPTEAGWDLGDNVIFKGYQQIQNFTWTLPVFQVDKQNSHDMLLEP